jgi:spore coat polysaccharide biosynthesis predicted glycosyltransferase SpsG
MQQVPVPIEPVVILADAGPEAGLGHVSRSSALAVALRCRGIDSECYARGSEEPFDRDGIRWVPALDDQHLDSEGRVVIIDSYLLPPDELERAAESSRLVVLHDFGGVPSVAALVVSPASELGNSALLAGFEYAALRPGFWGLPVRQGSDRVRRVLVTMGSGRFDALGVDVAAKIASALPEAHVTVVRGPHAGSHRVPEGVEPLAAPDSLVAPLLSADVAVTAGGQTMLEAAAAGTTCVALPVVENQKRQAERLARAGAVRVVESPDPVVAASAVIELAHNQAARREFSRRGQQAIDGYGALRVAFRVESLMRSAR